MKPASHWMTPLALASLLSGCGGGGSGNGDRPIISLSVAPVTIAVGNSASLTWEANGATGCSASGAWSGSRPISGSETVSPASAGTLTYTLTCTNAAGNSSISSSLVVTPPPDATLTFEGQVVDSPVASAAVTVRVGSRSFTGAADGTGHYSITATIPPTATADFVSIEAVGSTADPQVRFRSLVGPFEVLVAQAGDLRVGHRPGERRADARGARYIAAGLGSKGRRDHHHSALFLQRRSRQSILHVGQRRS